MKRVLCIVGSMNTGGAETFLMKVFRKLDKSKYMMDFAVAVEQPGFYDDEIEQMGGIIHHITPKSKGVWKNFYSLYSIVKNNRYKYVMRISQNSASAIELIAAYFGGATVRIFRSSNSNTTNASRKERILHKFFSFLPHIVANVRIAPSSEAADFMFGNNAVKKGKARILRNGIDLETYRFSEVDREVCRKELGLENAFVIGHIGRFNAQKNHEFLLDIFQEVKVRKENAKLLLVGTGELQERIEKKAVSMGVEKSVIFTGVRSDIARLLSAMDVFVFPSLYEGMPNTVIEAQATGVPCLIADTITKEAKITDLVQFKPLECPAVEWANMAIELAKVERNSQVKAFKSNSYDIESVAEEFVRMVFECK